MSDPHRCEAFVTALATGDAAAIFALAQAWGIAHRETFLVSGTLTRMAQHALATPSLIDHDAPTDAG